MADMTDIWLAESWVMRSVEWREIPTVEVTVAVLVEMTVLYLVVKSVDLMA